MKYGDMFYVKAWILSKRFAISKFRIDPVPFVHKRKGSYFRCWYKTPKTNNERKQFYGSEQYVRGRRRPRMLPNAWDDYPRADSYVKHSWKKNNKCFKQWMIHK